MNALTTLICCSLAFSLSSAAHARAGKDHRPTDPHPDPAIISAYLESFDSVGQLLNSLTEMHLITPDERRATLALLAEEKISFDTKVVSPRLNGGKLDWGSITLTIKEPGIFKTQAGLILQLNHQPTFDKAFAATLNAVLSQSNAGLFGAFVPSAYANTGNSIFEAVSAAAWTGAYHALKLYNTVVTYGAGTIILNGLGFPLEFIVVGLRNIIQKGTVVCRPDGTYEYDGGFKTFPWKQDYDKWIASYEKDTQFYKDGIGSASNGYSPRMMASTLAGLRLFTSVFSPKKAPGGLIDSELLKMAWPEGAPPKCTKENAHHLASAVRAKARQVQTKIQTDLAPAAAASDSKPSEGVR